MNNLQNDCFLELLQKFYGDYVTSKMSENTFLALMLRARIRASQGKAPRHPHCGLGGRCGHADSFLGDFSGLLLLRDDLKKGSTRHVKIFMIEERRK